MNKRFRANKFQIVRPIGTQFGIFFLIALGVLFSGSAAYANNVYVAQNSTGAGNGADCADAEAYTYFNTSGNWSATPSGVQIGPDTTVHLCGTFTGSAGGTMLTFQGSGTSGHPITLLWESGAIVQSPVFSAATGGININSHSYLVLNGGTNGIIQNTANGTGLANHTTSSLILNVGSNITIENLSLLNVYVHTNGDGGGGSSYGILARGASNLTVGPNNTFTQADVGFMYEWNGGESNLVITGNHWSGINQDIEMGPTTTGATMTNVQVDHNDATNWVNWDEPANGYHHNFFHPFTNVSGASITGSLQIYDNTLGGNMGSHATSMMFIENNNGGAGGSMGSWYIFNNTFDKTNANVPTSSGIVAVMPPNGFFYNNTIRDAGGTGANAYISFHSYSGASGWTLKNNIFQGGAYMVYNESSSITANNDEYYGSLSGTPWIMGSSFESSLSSWQAACSCDALAITTNPLLNGDLTIQAGSPAASIGANLISLGLAALDVDKSGIVRPPSGWSIGAYQMASSSANQPPNPPTGLSAIVN
jgi:hypothetical protein